MVAVFILTPAIASGLLPLGLQSNRGLDSAQGSFASLPNQGALPTSGEDNIMSDVTEIWRELEEEHCAWVSHQKKAMWRLISCGAISRRKQAGVGRK
ncbi:hypothetical protein ACJRO7_000417 [Eucalyptus globulus]|uniref:Uncharacterized protein n=1 Tax=Eucalyptus globulus TaxID=34317 RepID=A0ABD3LNK3_EUCGL